MVYTTFDDEVQANNIPPMKHHVYSGEKGIPLNEIDFSEKVETKEQDSVIESITPTRIAIPRIQLDAPVVPTGLNEEAQMEVPDNGEEVAWFEPGAKPGEVGNTVLAGHVDDYTGPAVFFYLKDLVAGDKIEITGEDGKVFVYVVKKTQSYLTDEAPVNEVFGESNGQHLNVVSCTGLYNKELATHEERLVIYTELAEIIE
ncbi:class F sortase [Saliterribacillus persicus]|uniref:LPXTG-site transpeptidase (Sortase) family protein n=1 Tax=Saliterribacillus persicus TaxID=930114 RepID=A0A368YAJ3_9BACI|nr:class F sortase [Saliterribacillus persicus]RCW77281.1 LPXTG-site transpeptidase (sortase) family protein [Saliterribacillus persicus]